MASVKVELNGADELVKLFERMPSLVVGKNSILENAVFAAALIVAKKAKQLAPDSRSNPKGDPRKKQSKKSKGIWSHKLSNTVTQKTINYKSSSWAIVGPKSPEGNMAHFMQEKPRRLVLWGKATMIQQYRDDRQWITKAFDETKSQQMSAMESTLRSDLDKLMSI